ncbi:hypothetical protein GT352_01960 [Streptomyces sp. SID1046]|uniref:hypothetical protein n=1 Tax=Streptomyces sp. SID1046 TaxID=2690249 RepID=UPI00136A3905|nr:hypothetical protein [Streptomyces sp. SID1046]MYV72722.1 hypothetical protein [Streptomyces sp. SID1046]
MVERDLDAVEETAERLRTYGPEGVITYSEQLQRVTAHLAELLELRYHTRQMAELLRLGLAFEGEPQPRFVNGAELSSL